MQNIKQPIALLNGLLPALTVHAACANCFVKYPGHPTAEAGKAISDFVVKQLRP
jgi:hypothetical protein